LATIEAICGEKERSTSIKTPRSLTIEGAGIHKPLIPYW